MRSTFGRFGLNSVPPSSMKQFGSSRAQMRRHSSSSSAVLAGETVAEGASRGTAGRRSIMPITFSIDMRASLIRTIGEGDVTPAEVDDHFTELSKVWPRGAKLDVLLDLSGCTSLPEILQ